MHQRRLHPRWKILREAICFVAVVAFVGCSPPSVRKEIQFRPLSIVDRNAKQATDESFQYTSGIQTPTVEMPLAPSATYNEEQTVYWDVSLKDVVRIALTNSSVLRDLGGRLVSQPNQAVTLGVPEIIRSDPRIGVDAALSAFDAQWQSALNYTNTENGLRNPIVGSNITTIHQQTGLSRFGFSKVGQAGTRYSVSQGHRYDADNVGVPPSRFHSAFDTFLNFEGRHPLARGGGRAYNAIAGPNSQFGTYNGYWIASVRSDIAEDELKISMRDYVYNVVRNYWLLRFAYDNVASRKEARDTARDLLKIAEEKYIEGAADTTVVLQAKEKYLAAQQLYDAAIEAPPERTLAGILGPNGALVSGSSLSLQATERRLRLIIGVKNGEGGLLRPIDNPTQVPLHYDYDTSIRSALMHRPELQRQTKVIEQRRMEWLAARNLRLPSVDLIGQYRVHGFGQKIIGDPKIPQDSSMSEFLNGNLQDLTAGVEVTRPVGNRLAMTAERNAKASMIRESSILEQQQLEISYEVASAIAEVERSQKVVDNSVARLEVGRQTYQNLAEKFENGIPIPIETILEARRVITELELSTAIARTDYSIALASLSVARGTLLTDVSVYCCNEDYYQGGEISLPLPFETSFVDESFEP